MKTKKHRVVISCTLNGKRTCLAQKPDGTYILNVANTPKGSFTLFGDAVCAIEKATGFNYPF